MYQKMSEVNRKGWKPCLQETKVWNALTFIKKTKKNIHYSKTNIFPENVFDQAVHLHLTAKTLG